LIIIVTAGLFSLYGRIAIATDVTNIDAHKSAVENLGTLAQSFADLVKVTVGAVIGALSAALQSLTSRKVDENDNKSSLNQDKA
jgi:hypothetical protein